MQDILKLPQMDSAKVCSAATTLHSRPVEWVSVIEIPVENFVRKNELVLSTAIGCGHEVTLFKQFVRDVIQSEAAALVLAKGPYIREVPEEVIQMASEADFPIIVIPWEVRFADITQAVLQEINLWQHRLLEQSEQVQQRLLHLFLSGKDLSAVARALQQKIDYPVMIVDRRGAIKGESKNAGPLVTQWSQIVDEHPELLLMNLTVPHHRFFQHELKSCYTQSQLITLFAIRYANHVQGYLVIAFPKDFVLESALHTPMMHIIEKAAVTTALWFQRETAIIETEMRLRGDFVWSLAKGEIDSWDQVLIRAKTFDFDMNARYSCIVGSPANLESVFRSQKDEQLPYENWLEEVVSHVEELITHTAKRFNHKIMMTFQRNHFIIYLETGANQSGKQAREFLDRVKQKIHHHLPGLVISWGIGEVQSGENAFQVSYDNARTALEIGTRQKGEGHVTTYAETGIYRVLRTLIHHEELRKVTLQTIGKLFEYDQNRGVELFHTLSAYIRNHGNVSQTARELNLHRQSLLYRLKKIETLTGLTLTDPDDLFLIELSAKLWTAGMADEQSKEKKSHLG